MPVSVITTIEELEALSQEWNGLLRTTDNDIVQLTHEWILCWWKSFGEPDKLYTLLVRNARNELIGIAPMMQRECAYRGVEVKKLSLLANGHSPSCDIIARKSELDVVVRALFDHFADIRTWDVVDLHKMRKDGPSYAAVMKHLDSRYVYGVKENIGSPYVSVNTDWSTFLNGRSQKFRKVLRNKINRANKAGDVAIEKIPIGDSSHPALNDMVEISAGSWKGRIGRDLRSNRRSRLFHMLLADALGPRGMVYLWLLKKGAFPAAFEYHVVYNDVAYPIRADYDETFKDLSPGSLLEHHILKTYFEESSVVEYYSCGDDYRYLLKWTDDIRRHVNIEIFNRKTLPFTLHLLEYKVIPVLRKLRINKNKKHFTAKKI